MKRALLPLATIAAWGAALCACAGRAAPPAAPALEARPARAERRVGIETGERALRHGRLREADAALSAALGRAEADGRRDARLAAALGAMGDLREAQGDAAAAETFDRRALSAWEDIAGPDAPETAAARAYLAEVLAARGAAAEAEQLLRRAIASSEGAPARADETAARLIDLAAVERARGKTEAAGADYRRALELTEKAFGVESPRAAECLDDLAMFEHSLAHDGAAEALYRRSLAIHEKLYDGSDARLLAEIDSLALFEESLGRDEEAEALYRRALERGRRPDGWSRRCATTRTCCAASAAPRRPTRSRRARGRSRRGARTPPGACEPGSGIEAVAEPRQRDDLRGDLRADLLAQSPDVGADRVRIRVRGRIVVPDGLEQVRRRERLAGPAQERGEQVELLARERDGAALDRDGAREHVEHEPVGAQDLAELLRRGVAAQDRLDLRLQQAGRHGLGQVVVGALVEPLGLLVGVLAHAGHQHDRDMSGPVVLAQPHEQGQSVAVGHGDVGQDDVRGRLPRRGQRLRRRLGPAHGIAGRLEDVSVHAAVVRRIVDKQNAHAGRHEQIMPFRIRSLVGAGSI
jgi:tetratricopeptide (TPR) repeat protein